MDEEVKNKMTELMSMLYANHVVNAVFVGKGNSQEGLDLYIVKKAAVDQFNSWMTAIRE